MKNELWGLYKPYQDKNSHQFYCYKCHELITDDLEFTVHIMKAESMDFRHYHIKCAPKHKLNYILSRMKQTKRTEG